MEKNAIVVTVCGTKGGTGKTSTSANMGGILADLGKQVCLIDADIQPALSSYYRLDAPPAKCLTELITARPEAVRLDDFVTRARIDRLGIIVSNDPQGKLHDWITQTPDGRVRLRQILRRPSRYDFIIIDSQGANSPLQHAAVLAADILISPIPPDMISAREFARGTLAMLDLLRPMEAWGAPLGAFFGLIYRMDRTNDSKAIAEQLIHDTFEQSAAKIRILNTIIPSLVAYRVVATEKIPVHRHNRRGLDTMADLIQELFPNLQKAVQSFVRREVA